MHRETLPSSHRPPRAGPTRPLPLGPWEGLGPAPELSPGPPRPRQQPPDADERDRRIMERVRAGDEQAFRCLFDTYWERLVVYAAAIMGDRGDECQDVVLQAFVRVWSHRAEWGGAGAVRPWLYRITRNLALNARRDRRVRDAHQLASELIEPLSQHHHTPAQRFEATCLRGEVEAAIDRLPERRREAFILSRYHGLSHRDIAVAMGISSQTVANQLSAAMADLRTTLARHLGDD